MARAEVTVLGAGIFGLSIAWACAQRGAKVQVIDPAGPGAGASGGIVGALAPHVPENWNDKKAFQLDSLLMAGTFWAEVEEASGLSSGYGRLGRVQPVLDDKALSLAHARSEGAAQLWGAHAMWHVTRNPTAAFLPTSPTGFFIHDTLSARVHPRKACTCLVAALRARGAGVVLDGNLAGHVVHATGVSGLEALSGALGKTVGNGVKGQGALLGFCAPETPQLFVNGLHIVPHADGTTAIGSTSEREFDDATSTDDQLDALVARARQALPQLETAPVLERWAALRPRSRSRAPMLGAHPVHKGQFIANGGFKIGFGMAPKVAEVMADLVLEGRDTIPNGFKPEASL